MLGADPHPSPLARPVALTSVIDGHLERILGSNAFASADSLRRLLRFVVGETIAGHGSALKEYRLGAEVLRKGESFDPKADPIVRVQMRRLRERLARYYATEGRYEPLVIEIPKGAYTPVFRAVPPGAAPAEAPAATDRLTVGHQQELADLRAAFDAACAGNGRLFCLSGEPGIGKTTLVETFLHDLTADGCDHAVGRGSCSERLAGSDAYLPVFEAIEALLRAGGEPLRRLMIDVAPRWHAQIAAAPSAVSTAGEPADSAIASQERLKREMVAFLREAARWRPVVLFIDDVHWADASTVDLLAYAITRCRPERLLTVVTCRSAELAAAGHPFLRVKLELRAHGICHEMPLPLLTASDVDRYLALQFPDHRFPATLAIRIHQRTEGNPLFMADLVRFLRNRGVLAQVDGEWRMAGELSAIEKELPESVRSMVERKVGELAADDHQLMTAAAVQGQEFDSAVVAAALRLDAAETEEWLEALDRTHGFVRVLGDGELPDGTLSLRYAFVHVLYQEALHDALSPTRRASLSRAVADALLRFHGDRAGEVASQLALLFEAGRDFAKASDFFLTASQNAARMYAADQAIALARQSIANAEKLSGRERHARVVAAALQSAAQQQSLTRLPEAMADLGLAERAAADMGDVEAQVEAIFAQALVLFLAKQMPEVRALGTRASEIARGAPGTSAQASSAVILAIERLCAGDVPTAEEQFDRAIPVLQQNGPLRHAITAVLMRGLLHTWRLEHDRGDRALEWAHARAGQLHSHFELLISLWHRARARANRGQLSEACTMLEEAMRLAELLGDRFWRPRIENTRGWLLGEFSDVEGALRLNTEAVRVARELGDVEAECNGHVNAAHDYLALGEPESAWAHLQQAEALYQRDNWFRWVYYPRLQAEMASCWIARGDLVQARACAQLSLERAAATVSRKRMAWAHKLLGDLAMLEDRPADAQREFASALRVIEHHPCPTIEWRILRAAADAAGALDGDAARSRLLGKARVVAEVLAGTIHRREWHDTFVGSKPIRDLLGT